MARLGALAVVSELEQIDLHRLKLFLGHVRLNDNVWLFLRIYLSGEIFWEQFPRAILAKVFPDATMPSVSPTFLLHVFSDDGCLRAGDLLPFCASASVAEYGHLF
jgi:hypothetical protein